MICQRGKGTQNEYRVLDIRQHIFIFVSDISHVEICYLIFVSDGYRVFSFRFKFVK